MKKILIFAFVIIGLIYWPIALAFQILFDITVYILTPYLDFMERAGRKVDKILEGTEREETKADLR